MSGQQDLQPHHNGRVEDIPPQPLTQVNQQIANIQNNFHLSQNIDLDKVAYLASTSPDLADRYMTICENQQDHSQSVDHFIMDIEEKEQTSRIQEKPYQRVYAFLSLGFAFTLSLVALGVSVYFASVEAYYLAATAISVPIGVAVANILGFKAFGQKKKEVKEVKEVKEDPPPSES